MSSQLDEFAIILADEGIFGPGELLRGMVAVLPKAGIQLHSISVQICGNAVLRDPKSSQILEKIVYLDKRLDLLSKPKSVESGDEFTAEFSERLPTNLVTSIESSPLTIVYFVKSRLRFSVDSEVSCLQMVPGKPAAPVAEKTETLTAVRGFTVIEPLSLDLVDPQRFQQSCHSTTKNYGFWPCTSGFVTLKFSLQRSAYLCGESIVIEGNVRNESKRRIESVVGNFEKTITVQRHSDEPPPILNRRQSRLPSLQTVVPIVPPIEPIVSETISLQSNELAMFVDPRSSAKISRHYAIPTVRPNTMADLRIGDFDVSIGYRLIVRMKQMNDICSITIPILIGTIPHQNCHDKRFHSPWIDERLHEVRQTADSQRKPHFQRDQSEKPTSLQEDGENYFLKRNRLVHLNFYPYFPDLSTSSKQSRQFKHVANSVVAESRFKAARRLWTRNQTTPVQTLNAEALKQIAEKPAEMIVEEEMEEIVEEEITERIEERIGPMGANVLIPIVEIQPGTPEPPETADTQSPDIPEPPAEPKAATPEPKPNEESKEDSASVQPNIVAATPPDDTISRSNVSAESNETPSTVVERSL